MNDDAKGSPKLSTADLAREAGTVPDYVDRLVAAGALESNAGGTFGVESVGPVRLTLALAEGGIGLDDLMAVIASGALQLDWVSRLWTLAPRTGRTFAEFAETLGDRAGQLPAIYAAFGLAVPPPETEMREDEEQAVAGFVDLWTMVDDEPDTYLRAARIAGEGVRRLQNATQDLFDELGGPPGSQLQRGKSPEEAYRPAMRASPVLAALLVWLQKRHMETETFGRVVDYVERTMAQQGMAKRPREPEAIAFVDLSGYTELTVEAGDEQAAHLASSLSSLAEAAARAYRGRVIKLLGDGVMLRYPSVPDAVRSIGSLMAAIAEADLPPAHAGVAAGPIVLRDGDVYGHTVNLAARIAAQAQAGEILVDAALADRLDVVGIHLVDLGEAKLKGLVEPVRLARISVTDGTVADGGR